MHFGDREHPPPHFHAVHGHPKVIVGLKGSVLEGDLPAAQLLLIRAWVGKHQAELTRNWELCQANKNPLRIEPLD